MPLLLIVLVLIFLGSRVMALAAPRPAHRAAGSAR
jgi:hypothetical protein